MQFNFSGLFNSKVFAEFQMKFFVALFYIGLSLACMSSSTLAAPQETQNIDEIVVYGSRAALESAINKQRDSDTVSYTHLTLPTIYSV